VYDTGRKFTCPYFAAFCVHEPGGSGPRIGFTTPRALGKSVVRNRIKRRVREAVRLRLEELNTQWSIVINPRRTALAASFADLDREVERLFRHCNGG
jgi:ribonuclease P protein component